METMADTAEVPMEGIGPVCCSVRREPYTTPVATTARHSYPGILVVSKSSQQPLNPLFSTLNSLGQRPSVQIQQVQGMLRRGSPYTENGSF